MSKSEKISELLEGYPPETQKLVKSTRTFLLATIPGIAEEIDVQGKIIGYGFGPGYKNMICSVMPTKIGVTMGIAWGTELPDPEKLMGGTGKVHRSIKLKQAADLEASALKIVLLDAVAHWKTKRKK